MLLNNSSEYAGALFQVRVPSDQLRRDLPDTAQRNVQPFHPLPTASNNNNDPVNEQRNAIPVTYERARRRPASLTSTFPELLCTPTLPIESRGSRPGHGPNQFPAATLRTDVGGPIAHVHEQSFADRGVHVRPAHIDGE